MIDQAPEVSARTIAANSGLEGAVIVERVRNSEGNVGGLKRAGRAVRGPHLGGRGELAVNGPLGPSAYLSDRKKAGSREGTGLFHRF